MGREPVGQKEARDKGRFFWGLATLEEKKRQSETRWGQAKWIFNLTNF